MKTKQYAVNLADLESEELHLKGTFFPGDIDFAGDDLLQLSDLSWSVTVEQKGGGCRFVGQFGTVLQLSCVRCVEPIKENIERQFDLFFEWHESELFENNDEIELQESDTNTAFLVESELFVDELIHEQVLLTISMKPLCSNECKGLCSTCGVDLNKNTCGCSGPDNNPAFEPLLEFKNRLQDHGDFVD